MNIASGTRDAAHGRKRYVGLVTAVVRMLPRHWDGQRLLRFLAGLALLALAFLPRPDVALATAPAAPVSSVTMSVTPAAAPAEAADELPTRSVETAVYTATAGTTPVEAGRVVAPESAHRAAYGSRAPPQR
jgi:hypothetical protein